MVYYENRQLFIMIKSINTEKLCLIMFYGKVEKKIYEIDKKNKLY